jgi:hypothetical protein
MTLKPNAEELALTAQEICAMSTGERTDDIREREGEAARGAEVPHAHDG